MTHHIVIVGGGAAGVATAARLDRKTGSGCRITLVEPADFHYYRSAYNLLGAGMVRLEALRRREAQLIPRNVIWEHQRVVAFEPEHNRVRLGSGDMLYYDVLVVCPGLELNWELITGAREALGRHGVCSIYTPELADYTWNCIRNVPASAKVVFTQPEPPYGFPYASHDVACLTADELRRKKLLDSCRLHFMTAAAGPGSGQSASGVPDRFMSGFGIRHHGCYQLVAVDGLKRTAVFHVVGGRDQGKKFAIEFHMLHITPPQSPPDVIKNSLLADGAGYVAVHPHSLQHVRYPNVFGLGDACSTPNPKTLSAIYRQVPVAAANAIACLTGAAPTAAYDGYSLAAMTTARGKAVFVHTVYGSRPAPAFTWQKHVESRLNWWVMRRIMPLFYWHYLMKGYAWFPPVRKRSGQAPGKYTVAS